MAKKLNKLNNGRASTKNKKEKFLDAFKEGLGIIKRACQKAEISRGTYYRWRKQDEEFKRKVDEIAKQRRGKVEDGLYEKIENGSIAGIKYYLSRKGGEKWEKTEKKEIEHSGKLTEKKQKPMSEKDREASKRISDAIINYLNEKTEQTH